MQTGVRTMIMRGGSSKGAYFVESDLPPAGADRDRLLLEIIGSPDPRQIDGIGGAHPLTSKVAIVRRSEHEGADVDYLFLQLGVDQPLVTDRQNCGNLLAGVAPFAIERGLVAASGDTAVVRINMLNTESFATATVMLDDGQPVYAGTTAIAGVPGTASPVRLDFEDVAGGSCGSLLPTGNVLDIIDGVPCTLIDNGMPVVVVQAQAVGVSGYESPAELEANQELIDRLEAIRLVAGKSMNLGDVTDLTVPKITMVATPQRAEATLCTRTFIPHRCHQAIGVLGAVSVATAALLPGSPAYEVAASSPDGSVVLEHPTGRFETAVTVTMQDDIFVVGQAGIIRTARKLMDGVTFPRDYE